MVKMTVIKDMITISLCMIVKNEEEILERCLNSIGNIPNEIIIVDTGSTDRTREIASKYTKNIYDYEWKDDFAAARNYAFSKASMQYCMWMDADDVLPQKEKEKFLYLKENLAGDVDMVMMLYAAGFTESGAVSCCYYRERLMRNNHGYCWKGRVHEAVVPYGKVICSDVTFEHRKLKQGDPRRNLRIYEKMITEKRTEEGKEKASLKDILEPREMYYYARELMDHGLYEKAQEVFGDFLKRTGGSLVNKKDACRMRGFCLGMSGQKESQLEAYLEGLKLGSPNPQLCCDIGNCFMERQRWKDAGFWYRCALKADYHMEEGEFVWEIYKGYIPCLQLCVCSYRMGEIQEAKKWNEKAGEYEPEGREYLENVRFFSDL